MPVLNPNSEMILFEIYDWDFGLNRDDFMYVFLRKKLISFFLGDQHNSH